MKLFLKFNIGLLVWFISCTLYAFNYNFLHLTIDDGLSNNAVYSIFQDSKGFMWFGTIDGIHCFDGKHLRVIRNNNPEVYAGNLIYSIAEDDQQRLWIGTDHGLALYCLKEEKFISLPVNGDTARLFDTRIYDLYLDSRKCMWIATATNGLFRFDLKSRALRHFSSDDLPALNVRDIMEDKKGQIWLTLPDKGVICYDDTQNKFRTYSNPEVHSGLLTFEDSQANIWLGTAGKGLFKIDPETGTAQQVIKPSKDYPLLQIRSMTEFRPGELLLTSDEGLIHYFIQTDRFEIIKCDPTYDAGLNDNYLHAILMDQEKGIWIGSYFGGINYISPTSDNFTHYSSHNYPFKGKVISAFAKDENENLWVGTDDSGFFYWDRNNNTFKEFKPQYGDNNSPTYQNVHALLPDGDKLYIGMYMGGLDILDLKTRQVRNHRADHSANSLYASGVYSLYKDFYGKIWVGTSGGLNTYNPKEDNFERIKEVANVDVTSILEDQKGYLWVSTLGGGVFRLNRKNAQWEHFKYSPHQKNTIPVNKVTTITLDDNNQLWFGTDGGGLCRFNYANNEFIDYTSPDFPSKVIYKIISEHDILWISTSKGLMKYNTALNSLQVFNKFDGLQDNQFSPNAGVKMKDGTLYFGGINGFNGFRPSSIIQNNRIPTVVLTNFQLFNKKVPVNKDNSPLKTSITYTDELILKKEHSIFSLEFAALSFTGAYKNRYKYMLEGFESEWTETTNEPSVTYTNLPAGKYMFRVKASNGDGIWNDAGIALPITVLPPVWLSIPFLTGYFILFISLLVFYFQYLRRRHKKEIAYLSIEKEKEIYSTKINFFTHIVHEIRTPLTLILGPLKSIMNSGGEIKDVMPQLELMERNSSRLLSLVNQLMDFRKIEDGGLSVIPQETCLNEQLEDLYKRFRFSAELKNVEISLFIPDESFYALTDEDAFVKIMSNLLSNALKFTRDKITLTLRSAADPSMIEIEVADNGPGIDPKEQENIFKPFYQIKESQPADYIGTGIGLLLVRKLIEMQNGTVSIKSSKGHGASFIIRLPRIFPDRISQHSEMYEKRNNIVPEILQSEQKKPSVLLVDDNRDLLLFLEDTLSPLYNTTSCMDGNEAIAFLKKETADLIISDVMMPNMDGMELCAAIKKNILTSHIPVLLLTAKVGTEDRIQGLENGADVYIEKPFSPDVLKAQIASLLSNRERIRKNFREEASAPLTSVASTKVDELFLEKIYCFIEENLSDTQLSVDAIAKEAGMGRTNFFTKVKSLAGVTPNELIRVVRLKKARELFDAGENCISDICFRVGFSSPSYFSKCFQQQFGVSPSEYVNSRKMQREYA